MAVGGMVVVVGVLVMQYTHFRDMMVEIRQQRLLMLLEEEEVLVLLVLTQHRLQEVQEVLESPAQLVVGLSLILLVVVVVRTEVPQEQVGQVLEVQGLILVMGVMQQQQIMGQEVVEAVS